MKDINSRVHIIDDDSIILDLLKSMVESIGIVPSCYNSAEKFLETYTQAPRECVVSDIRMPGLSGLQLQKRLQEKYPVPPPLILVTGYAEVSAAVEAMKQGAYDFVEKPVNGYQFLEKVQGALEVSQELHAQRLHQSARDARLALLTPKEREVLEEVLKGQSSKDIASDLGLSTRTVENHRSRLMAKLRVKSTVDLVREFGLPGSTDT